MSDRLVEIKESRERVSLNTVAHDYVPWLIDEVESLRERLTEAEAEKKRLSDLLATNLADCWVTLNARVARLTEALRAHTTDWCAGKLDFVTDVEPCGDCNPCRTRAVLAETP